MMTEGFILAMLGIIEAVLTSIVTFLLTRRKYRNEVKEGEIHNDGYKIENDEKKFDLYVKMINENEKHIDRLQEKNNNLEQLIAEIRSVVFGMLQQVCTDMMCQGRKFDQSQCPYYETIFNLRKDDTETE